MSFDGLIIGIVTFAIIGVFHPIVIKGEYYFSQRIWPVFLIAGIALCAVSMYMENHILQAIAAIAGVSSLWSIGEIRHQAKRVAKGWYPANPTRMDKERGE